MLDSLLFAGGWIDGLLGKSQDGPTKHLQMAKPSAGRTHQWQQVSSLLLFCADSLILQYRSFPHVLVFFSLRTVLRTFARNSSNVQNFLNFCKS